MNNNKKAMIKMKKKTNKKTAKKVKNTNENFYIKRIEYSIKNHQNTYSFLFYLYRTVKHAKEREKICDMR